MTNTYTIGSNTSNGMYSLGTSAITTTSIYTADTTQFIYSPYINTINMGSSRYQTFWGGFKHSIPFNKRPMEIDFEEIIPLKPNRIKKCLKMRKWQIHLITRYSFILKMYLILVENAIFNIKMGFDSLLDDIKELYGIDVESQLFWKIFGKK